jgi:hypothetical protein
MVVKLGTLLIVDMLSAATLVASTVAMALGAFTVIAPRRAAEIWGSSRLKQLPPERSVSFVTWFRIFGILLFLSGMLVAVDGILFPSYHR